jgi:hypothetical protein
LIARRIASGLACALLLASAGAAPQRAAPQRAAPLPGPGRTTGPFDLLLFATPKAPNASARAHLIFAHSPFGIAVTQDGRAVYDVQVTIAGLAQPSTLGPYTTYVSWAVTPNLDRWVRLGTVRNGTTTVGPIEWNKFLFVISAESSDTPAAAAGPTVLHGTSPSGYLQSFMSHPLFRGVPQ